MNIFDDLVRRMNKIHEALAKSLDSKLVENCSADLSQMISEIYDAYYGKRQTIDDGEFSELYIRATLLSKRLLLIKK